MTVEHGRRPAKPRSTLRSALRRLSRQPSGRRRSQPNDQTVLGSTSLLAGDAPNEYGAF